MERQGNYIVFGFYVNIYIYVMYTYIMYIYIYVYAYVYVYVCGTLLWGSFLYPTRDLATHINPTSLTKPSGSP